MARLASLWRNLTRRRRIERELDDEVRAAFDLLVEEKQRTGLSAGQARRAAQLELHVESVKQQVRDARSGATLETVAQDIRYAARLLWRQPIFTCTAALSLAIGIAATTAVFTVANGVLMRAAAGVTDPATLVDVVRRDPTDGPGVELMSFPDLVDLRRQSSTLDGIFGYQLVISPASLRMDDGTGAAFVDVVTTNYFQTLGVTATAGRLFDAGDRDEPGASPIAVLSHRYWMRRFAGDRSVIGRTARLNTVPVTIVGIAAEHFAGLSVVAPDVWIPPSMIGVVSAEGGGREIFNRAIPWLMVGARLKNGVSRTQASAETASIGAAIQRGTPKNTLLPEGAAADPASLVWSVETASPIPYGLRTLAAGFLALLMAVVSTVLVIACANLAGVLLARATSRRREMAVRTAVGAGRQRLIRQLLTETVLLFTLGGVTGLTLARVLTTLLVSLLPEFPVPVNVSVPLDLRVVSFALAVSFAAAILAGLAPALHGSNTDVVAALKDDAQGPSDRLRLRNAFVIAQVACSILLVVVAALLVRGFDNTVSVSRGFDPRGVEVMTLDLTMGGYTEATGRDVVKRLLDRIRDIPGVERATIADRAPGAGGGLTFGNLTVPGAMPEMGAARTFTNWMLVEPDFFATAGIPLVAGRDFTDADRQGAELVAIVGERTARRLWADRDPIGQLVSITPPGPEGPSLYSRDGSRAPNVQLRIVGVAGDVNAGVQQSERTLMTLYVPLQQKFVPQVSIIARGDPDRSSLVRELRTAVDAVDSSLSAVSTGALERQADGPVQTQLRIAATVAGSVGVIGLFLAGIGIYGVTAYAVTQRTREIGIRLSLGAGRGDVIGLVLKQGMTLVGAGSAIGLVLGLGAGRLLAGRRFGIPQADPLVLLGAAVLFAVVGLIACYVPVRRAARIRAMEALRYE